MTYTLISVIKVIIFMEKVTVSMTEGTHSALSNVEANDTNISHSPIKRNFIEIWDTSISRFKKVMFVEMFL
jgi:hypothetical protein